MDANEIELSKIAQRIVESLNGTCNDLDQAIAEEGIELEKDRDYIRNYVDEHIYCCGTCGWWDCVSSGEEDGTCVDCQDDDDEDEE